MTEHNRQYKVQYSFLHRNEHPYLADEYRIYRQDGPSAEYQLIDTINASEVGIGEAITVTGMDIVYNCGVVYNYKVSAYNDRGEIECINPLFSGIDFPCPTPTRTPTPTISPSNSPPASPSLTPTKTPSLTPTKSITPTVTPSISASNTPPGSPSVTPTVTPSISVSKTPPGSPSVTPTVTPSISVSKTPPGSPSVTPTLTKTPTVTPSVTRTPGASVSVTPSISVSKSPPASPSVTPSISASVTPSKSPPASPSVTPSISVSVTPSKSPPASPSVTPTPSSTPPAPQGNLRQLFTVETNGAWSSVDGGVNVSDSSLVNVTIDGQTSNNGIQWPAGATSFTVVGLPLGGTNFTTSVVEGNVPNHAPGGAGQPLSQPDFGGFANSTSVTIQSAGNVYSSTTTMKWAGGYDTSTAIPKSTNLQKIPLKFESTAGDFWGIFDFGMFDCANSECADRNSANTIPNNGNNDNIHLRVKIAKDDPQGGTVQNVASNNAKITFSGEWGFS